MIGSGKAIALSMMLAYLLLFSPAGHAREYTVGTLAYSYISEGYPNIFVQGSIDDRSAWFVDKCDDNGNTVAALYKKYRHQVSRGPYWFAGLIYIAKGNRSGISASAGLGYEHTTRKNITFGAYIGGAAGGDNGVSYAVGNLTLGYTFR